MSTPFDPKKALREEIEGLGGIVRTIGAQTASAERKLGEAEAEFNALNKLRAFATAELARKRTVLQQLELDEAANK